MKHRFQSPFHSGALLIPFGALLLALGGCSASETTTTTTSTTQPSTTTTAVEWRPLNGLTIPAPSLAGNLLGDPAERTIMVYLPPQYFTDDSALPVVYYLAGHNDELIRGISAPADFDAFFATHDPLIVVLLHGVNRMRGSFYVDSPVTGDWAQFVTRDVVGFVDSNFRTIPDRASRGVAGHSMGGFGALDLAMRNSEVFGATFAMAPGLFDEEGLSNSQMFPSETYIRNVIELITSVEGLDTEAAIRRLSTGGAFFDIGYGMAFAPTTELPFLEYPYRLVGDELVRDDAIWAKWESGFGGISAEVEEFHTNLASLAGIGIDCGIGDEYQWIPQGCAYLDAQLTAAGIDHQYTTHPGRHGDRNRERVTEFLLPFFLERLAR